jgi:general stress protein YciG
MVVFERRGVTAGVARVARGSGESKGGLSMVGNKPGPAKGDPRMVEAGRRGGQTVKEERGREFFQSIGQKGGQATKEKYGPEFFSQIGRKGGESVKRERGVEFYSSIGRKGGSSSRVGKGRKKTT